MLRSGDPSVQKRLKKLCFVALLFSTHETTIILGGPSKLLSTMKVPPTSTMFIECSGFLHKSPSNHQETNLSIESLL